MSANRSDLSIQAI